MKRCDITKNTHFGTLIFPYGFKYLGSNFRVLFPYFIGFIIINVFIILILIYSNGFISIIFVFIIVYVFWIYFLFVNNIASNIQV